MANDDRDLLTVLKAELEFLEKGGYRQSPSAPWRPQFIFEDSPTCMNHDRRENPLPCSECILLNLVPADCRNEKIPCRHIPLNPEGFTIDTYYRLGTQEEVEAAVAAWLRKAIQGLEGEDAQQQGESRAPEPTIRLRPQVRSFCDRKVGAITLGSDGRHSQMNDRSRIQSARGRWSMQAVQARTRITLKNVLFATDFSPAADLAAPIAIQIARRYGAKVYGVHVNRFGDSTAAAPNGWAAMGEAVEKETKEDAGRLNEQLQGIEHEVVVKEGRVSEVVSALIKEKEIDLVVVGTRGRTGFGKALLGSVAEQILRQSSSPVLTVGPHVNPWSDEYAQMREILYATDLVADSPIAAPYAVSLAQENQAHLVLLHVIEDPKAGDLVHSPEVVDFKERKLQQLVSHQAGLWCDPTYIVEQGTVAEKILDVANRRHTDLIVLGARPARGLATHLNAGTVHKIVSQAKCPVLTVRG